VWWCHADLGTARWTTPPECAFDALLPRAAPRGHVGPNGRWLVLEDVFGNTFYQDRRASKASPECRWDRPADAVRVDGPAPAARCTRFAFGAAAAEQAWYGSESLSKLLPVLGTGGKGDKFRACMPCAKRLLRAVRQVVDTQASAAPPKGQDADSKARDDAKAAAATERALADRAHPILGGLGGACRDLKFKQVGGPSPSASVSGRPENLGVTTRLSARDAQL
jgi:hypothetical protein